MRIDPPRRGMIKLASSTRTRELPATVLTATPKAERLTKALVALQAEAKAIEERKKALQGKFCKELRANGVPNAKGKLTMESTDYKNVLIEGESSNIDPKVLLALGVTPKIIKAATKKTPYEYVGIYDKRKPARDGK